jgi:parvulin-like peptidyl-prolyl cis-trans isomerase-like protein
MWAVTHLLLFLAISISLLQNSNPAGEQSSVATKPETNLAKGAKQRSDSGTSNSNRSKTKKAALVAPPVATTQPVLTVRGLCEQGSSSHARSAADPCTRVITRGQFEILMNALNPDGRGLAQDARRNLAKTYAEYLAVEAAVRRAGMDDSPEFRKLMEWTRLRATTDFFRYRLEQKYRTPPGSEIEAYYHRHLAEYERVGLARILVPRENVSASNKEAFDKKARDIASAAQARAVKGEDPQQIQNDANAALGISVSLPVNLGKRRRADLVPEEAAELFSLKAGEVSQVETESRSYVVYKVLSKDVVPLEEVKAGIAREIYQRKFKEAMKSALDAVPAELNEQYFGSGNSRASPRDPAAPASTRPH